MRRKRKESVAVVTGASSGIGRATALALAARGASVVVASRREQALRELVAEIESQGGRALAVPTDVTDQQAMVDLANRAVDRFEGIDVWVNNAGVYLLGAFADTPDEDFRRVMETNFFGQVHGARAALPIFREQGAGILVNIASLNARVPQPHASAYIASKHAVRGLSMSLRQELLLEGADDIHVVTVLPAVIDTPIFQQSGNYTGRKIQPPPPVYPAEDVVKAILDAIRDPKPEVFAGKTGRGGNLFMKLMPGATERLMTEIVHAQEIEGTSAPSTSGNLFTPSDHEPAVSGGWKPDGPSTASRVTMAGLGAAAALLAAMRLRERRS